MTYYTYDTMEKRAWYGILPSHWGCKKIGTLFFERKTKVSDQEYAPLSVARVGVVPQLITAAKTNAGDNRKLVCVGDFAINSRSDRKGSCGISQLDGSVSLINIVLIPRDNLSKKYAHYILRSQPFSEEFYRHGRGIVSDLWTTRYADMKSILLPFPPRDEQDQIVRFLDWKVSRINKLINIKKCQIEQLIEIKHSKIAHLVMGQTKSITMKESKINWVKKIPRHWMEKLLIQVAKEQKIKNTGLIEKNLLSLSYGRVISKDINTTDGLLPLNFEGYQIVYNGNIILRLTDLQNDQRSLRTGLVKQKGIITSAYTCLEVRDGIMPEYLQLQLHIADLYKILYRMGGGVRQSIGFREIRKLVVAIPTLEEQQLILKSVHKIEKLINNTIQHIQKMVEDLENLKARLIADVVTGQIDVRNIEIPDYEAVEETVDDFGDDNEDADYDGQEGTNADNDEWADTEEL